MESALVEKITELDQLAKKAGSSFKFRRPLFKALSQESSGLYCAIIGPRGVGKTVLMQQLAALEENSLYFSADTLDPELDLFDLLKRLKAGLGYTHFFIDEIHFNRDFLKSLKNAYDFLDVKLTFSSSVALSLVKSSYDLSRRVKLFELHLFSFWEYLQLQGKELEPLGIQEVIDFGVPAKYRRFHQEFELYLRGGALPYARENQDFLATQSQILETIIQKDIPASESISTDDLFHMKKLVRFVAKSSVDGVNYSAISKNLSITKYKAGQYVDLLAQAFVLNVSFPHGANVMREPKILMYLPNRLIFSDYEEVIGGLREDFASTMFRRLGLPYFYLKTKRGSKTPDFLFEVSGEKIICEIGGTSKGKGQLRSTEGVQKRLLLKQGPGTKREDIPLYYLGLIE